MFLLGFLWTCWMAATPTETIYPFGQDQALQVPLLWVRHAPAGVQSPDDHAADLAQKAWQLHQLIAAGWANERRYPPEALSHLQALQEEARAFLPAPTTEPSPAPGRSRTLGQRIAAQSKAYREAITAQHISRLLKLNQDTQRWLDERIPLQLATAEKALQQNNFLIAQTSLLGAMQSFHLKRIELYWERVHRFRQTRLDDFLSIEGLDVLNVLIPPSFWQTGPVYFIERRWVYDAVQKRKWLRKVFSEYTTKGHLVKSRLQVIRKSYRDAVDILYHLAHLRYVEMLLEGLPSKPRLEKARDHIRRIHRWAQGGGVNAKHEAVQDLSDLQDELDGVLLHFGDHPHAPPELSRALLLLETTRDRLKQERLPEVLQIRNAMVVQLSDLVLRSAA